MKKVVCHLVEAGKANHPIVVEQVRRIAATEIAEHRIIEVEPGARNARRIEADMVCSHLPIQLNTFPLLVALRAANPDLHICHVAPANDAPKKISAVFQLCGLALFDQVITDQPLAPTPMMLDAA